MNGLLFSSDFLHEGIREMPGWMAAEPDFIAFRESLSRTFGDLSNAHTLNEAQTEDDIIVPVLDALGWGDRIRQANTSGSGRHDIPDFLLFASAEARRAARAERNDARRYRHGKLIVEAKRWDRPLDRGDGGDPLDAGTPSSQMLRYLSRVGIVSDGAVEWGILTNGRIWRLYWQNARSRAEEFLQFDLAALAGVAGTTGQLFAPSNAEDVHYLRAFFLLFRRQAFGPQPDDAGGRSFHAIALEQGRQWETKVSGDLGGRVFDELFPALAAAIVHNDGAAHRPYTRDYFDEVHRSALILLYRLLFVLYAEDRGLLPVNDQRYDDYSLRWQRLDIAARRDRGDAFSDTASRIWQHLRSLFRAIDQGDDSIGLPPYNGGLFHEEPGDLLARIELRDAELAPLIDGLSRRPDISERGFINYRDLAVQHLGSIYERLLEQRLVETADGSIAVQPSTFARKNTGSYYTHDDLVKLILRETLDPLAAERVARFDARLDELLRQQGRIPDEQLHPRLAEVDTVEGLLELRICDPAMGSGHFLVSLVDDLADRVLEQLADVVAKANAAGISHYRSPVSRDIEALRTRILARAQTARWHVDPALLDDRHLVRRMILKRVVHGIDKNPMAVELAKLALWLHTFTVGAPLSFLDHHLRCGDSIYGERLATVRAGLSRMGGLFNDSQTAGLMLAAQTMRDISALNDVDLAEVERSRDLAEQAFGALEGLRRVFDLWQALRWIAPLDAPPRQRTDKHAAASELLSGRYRLTLLELLGGEGRVHGNDPAVDVRVNALLDECRALAARERFLHWELAFPGVWRQPTAPGGFDAVIGNPPWDRIKLQEVEWFAERRPQIALQPRAADRKRMVAQVRREGDSLGDDYDLAARRAEDAARVARDCGEYPLLSGGDTNLYSLFVERAASLTTPQGMIGLLTPSGIAADKGAARFFRGIATTGRLSALFDFENRKIFFPDIHASFKFCALVFGGSARTFEASRCAFFLHSTAELQAPQLPEDADEVARKRATRVIPLTAADFRAVNPNTGTAPIFRNAFDADLTTRLYRHHPVLVRHVFGARRLRDGSEVEVVTGEERLYPIRYCTMFHMTNDSGLFRGRTTLETEGWYPVAGGRWRKGGSEMLPLYEGKMVQAYDHRAASVVINPENVHRPAVALAATAGQHADPDWLPSPQFYVGREDVQAAGADVGWQVGFKEITAPTNMRSMIAAVLPEAGFGNKVPLLLPEGTDARRSAADWAPLLVANLNSIPFDFVTRQKLQGQTLNLFIVEQLPFIALTRYAEPLGHGIVGDFVREQVLHLSYTAHDLTPFARDLGYEGPPFAWDPEARRHRIARLDALYFSLYGLDRDEAAYVLDTFPIIREQDERAFGRYRTKELVLGYMNALAAGDTDTVLAL